MKPGKFLKLHMHICVLAHFEHKNQHFDALAFLYGLVLHFLLLQLCKWIRNPGFGRQSPAMSGADLSDDNGAPRPQMKNLDRTFIFHHDLQTIGSRSTHYSWHNGTFICANIRQIIRCNYAIGKASESPRINTPSLFLCAKNDVMVPIGADFSIEMLINCEIYCLI